HGRRGRMFRGEREEESGYAYGRGFGEPGETYERAYEGPGYAYGRGYGGPDASGGDYYSIYQGRALGAREPRSDYDRGLYSYSPQKWMRAAILVWSASDSRPVFVFGKQFLQAFRRPFVPVAA